ncbi:MAG: hypothetical protein JW384_02380 [Nitrosomonadaceae bacterium]|nr:hypothetical protein [Nitrosomonadaceae bacterium]
MKVARPLVLLLVFLFASIAGMYTLASSSASTSPPQQVIVVAGDPLTEAIKSAVTIRLDFLGGSGTGVLIGRTKLENGNWKYMVLTAYHVMDILHSAMKEHPDKLDSVKKLTLVYQAHFHAPLTLLHTSLIDFHWMVPAYDWAIFSVELAEKLPCAQLATKEEFESIQPYNHIYGVGSDGSDGLFLRDGVIASTNGTQPFIGLFGYDYPWDVNQDGFFRVYHGIYYGASGGPVFNRQGKIIGVYNGYVHMHMNQPVTNLAVVAKGHLVEELLTKSNSNITKVEN